MNKLLDLLSGKKTYVTGGLGVLAIALYVFGVIDQETAQKAVGALGLGSILALRAAIAKSEAQAAQTAQKVAALQRGERTYLG